MISEIEVSYKCGHVRVVKDVPLSNNTRNIYMFQNIAKEKLCPTCHRRAMYSLGKNIYII